MLHRVSVKNILAAALPAAGLAFVCQTQAQAAVSTVYADNVSKTTAGSESVSGTRRLTSSFTTGAELSYLQSVTLLLSNPVAGQATVYVYANGLDSPGTLVGSLTSPASFSSSTAETTFTARGISLAANITYSVAVTVTRTGDTSSAATVAYTTSDITVSSENPADAASFFVRQRYVDFLNREPDSSGLTFWTGEIANRARLEFRRLQLLAGQAQRVRRKLRSQREWPQPEPGSLAPPDGCGP